MSHFIPGTTITDGRRVLRVNDDYSLSYLDGAGYGASVASLGDEWRQVTILEQVLAGASYSDAEGFPEPAHRFGARYDVGGGRVALCVFPGTIRAWTVTGARRRLTWPEVAAFIPEDHQIAPLRNVLADASDAERRGTAHFGDCVRLNDNIFAIYAFPAARRQYATNGTTRRMTLDEAREFADSVDGLVERMTPTIDETIIVTSQRVIPCVSLLDLFSDALMPADEATNGSADEAKADEAKADEAKADEAKADEATNGSAESDSDPLHDMSDLMREMLRGGEQAFRDLTETVPIPDEVRDKAGRFLSDLTKAVSNLKD